MDIGHWNCEFTFNPEEWFGFIYRIVEKSTGRQYIGKKQFHQHLRKTVPGKKNKKKIIKESNWKKYTSSSTHINAAIELNGLDSFSFHIESLHESRASLYYEEVRVQIIEDVLRTRMPDGVTPKYFNRQVAAVRFIPPVETLLENTHKKRLTLI